MIGVLALGLTIALDVREFFPIAAGTVWTYETSGEDSVVTSKMTAGAPETIGGEEAIPFVTTVLAQKVETIYYRVSPDAVSIVGYDPKTPFRQARPLLMAEHKGSKWTYEADESGIPLKMECSTSIKKPRRVLDQTVDVLELKVTATLGAKGPSAMEMKQTALYGKGIGLFEIQEERKAGKVKAQRQIRLVQFQPAPGLGGR